MFHIPMQKFLGDYIKKVEEEEYTFDSWINDPIYHMGEGKWMSRAELWDDAEIYAAKVGWEAALKGKK